LSGQGLDDFFYPILLYLISGLANMNLRDHCRSGPFRQLSRDAQEVKGSAGVSMLLSCECRAKRYYALLQGSGTECDIGPLFQDLSDLLSIVGRKDDLVLTKRALHPGIKKLCELEVIGYADDAHPRSEEVGVYPGEVIENIVSLSHQFIHLVQHYHYYLLLLIQSIPELCINLICGPTGHRNISVEVPCQVGQNPVLGIDYLAVDVYHNALHIFKAGLFQFFSHIFGHRCLSGASLSVYEDIRGRLTSQSWDQNRCKVIDLLFSVRQFGWCICRTQDVSGLKYLPLRQ